MLGSRNDDEGVGAAGAGGGGTQLPDSSGGRAASSALSLVPSVPDPLIISVFNNRGGCCMSSSGYLKLCTILAMTHQANHADFFTLPDNLDHPEYDDDMLSDEDTEEDRGGAGIDDVD
jgi:hypothetical protein